MRRTQPPRALPAGRTALRLAPRCDGLLYVLWATLTGRSPLVVVLHGAGSSACVALRLPGDVADAHGLIGCS